MTMIKEHLVNLGKKITFNKELSVSLVNEEDFLKIKFENELPKSEKYYWFVFDKNKKNVLCIGEVEKCRDNVLGIKPLEIKKKLEVLNAFNYARLCIACEDEGKITGYYLKNAEEGIKYFDNFDNLTVYYSNANLVSVKFIDMKVFCEKNIQAKICDIKIKESKIQMIIDMQLKNSSRVEYDLESEKYKCNLSVIDSNMEKSNNNQVVLEVDASKLLYDTYTLKVLYRGIETKLQLEVDESYLKQSNNVFQIGENELIIYSGEKNGLKMIFKRHVEENAKNLVLENLVRPSENYEADIYVKNKKLYIDLSCLMEQIERIEDVALFLEDSKKDKIFFAKEYPINNGVLCINIDRNLLLQMNFLKVEDVKVGIVFRQNENWFCGFIKRKSTQDTLFCNGVLGEVAELDNRLFIAYSKQNGLLAIKFWDEEKFRKEYYKIFIENYRWKNSELVAYFTTPFIDDRPIVKMYSITSNTEIDNVNIIVEKELDTDARNVWKFIVDISAFSEEDSDGYYFICNINQEEYEILLKKELEQWNLCEVPLKSEAKLKASVVRDKSGKFVIKTGGIYPVLVSIVTAVYNTAPFLAEMINSVLAQDINELAKNCGKISNYKNDYYGDTYEFILVDDGATDGSGEILDDYARLSDKISVIHKENGGVSSARNAGIEVARGKYITFPDSDDKLSANVLDRCVRFFEKNYDNLTIVTYGHQFFDAETGGHWTNYRFDKGTRILNAFKEWDKPLYFTNATFFKAKDIKNKIFFDKKLINGEDIKFIHELLFKTEPLIGLVADCTYWYRRRSMGELSAIQASKSTVDYYISYMKNLMNWLLNTAKKTYGEIPKYVQYVVMGQLQWRIKLDPDASIAKTVIGEDGFNEYRRLILNAIKQIDDDVILAQRKIWSEHKFYILKEKYGEEPKLVQSEDDAYFYFGDSKIGTSLASCYIRLQFLEVNGDKLHVEGYAMKFQNDVELEIHVNNQVINYNSTKQEVTQYALGEVCFYADTFEFDIPLNDSCDEYNISFYNRYKDIIVRKKAFRFAKTMPLAQSYNKSYFAKNGWAIRWENENIVARKMTNTIINYEMEFVNQLNKSKNIENIREMIELRQLAQILIANKKKKIWLISDRVNAAGDNGEAMFRFINKKKDPNIEAFFVIKKESDDYQELCKIGKVIDWGSKQHLVLHLAADYIISSAGNEFVVNPWTEDKNKAEVVRDYLARNKYIFLQHGITKDDISGWLNRYNKNIKGFVCAAPREAQSILDYNYYYKKEDVWLTGFPRHDRLYHNEKNYIIIMPTWREYLTVTSGTENNLIKNFEDSDYCIFYNNLINNERLLAAAEKYGYKICFMPHPGVKRNGMQYFHKDPRVEFFGFDKKYCDVYAEGCLTVTDYSSAVMDFALLRKPIVYCHFDKEKFYENHIYSQGYFDYEKDGFGEVTYQLDELVDVLVEYMKNKCKLKEKYKERMDKFFPFTNKNNCERVYEKIKKLDVD